MSVRPAHARTTQARHQRGASTRALGHAAVGAMSARARGYVIDVSAGNAFFPTPGSAAHGASKAFIKSLAEALAYELSDGGVRPTAVCHGFTRTGAQDRLGLNRQAFPRFMWRNADGVARDALRDARRKRVVSGLDSCGAFGAFDAPHLPQRLLTPLVARATARFASG